MMRWTVVLAWILEEVQLVVILRIVPWPYLLDFRDNLFVLGCKVVLHFVRHVQCSLLVVLGCA